MLQKLRKVKDAKELQAAALSPVLLTSKSNIFESYIIARLLSSAMSPKHGQHPLFLSSIINGLDASWISLINPSNQWNGVSLGSVDNTDLLMIWWGVEIDN